MLIALNIQNKLNLCNNTMYYDNYSNNSIIHNDKIKKRCYIF